VPIEAPAARDHLSITGSTAGKGVTRGRGSKGSGPHTRANACLASFGGTVVTGLLIFGQVPHGDAWATVPSPSGGPAGLRVLHVIFAAMLTVASLWHLFDRRRSLAALARRGGAGRLRGQLAYAALVGPLAASLVTGFAGDGRSQVAHHTAVAIVLSVACTWHGLRQIARRRRTPQGAPTGVRL
jgi:hypothetical protein